MKIPEAIKILSDPIWQDLTLHDQGLEAATKLAIEALKSIESCRVGDAVNVELPLPGEID